MLSYALSLSYVGCMYAPSVACDISDMNMMFSWHIVYFHGNLRMDMDFWIGIY